MILDILLIGMVLAISFLYYRQDAIIKSQIDHIDDLEKKHIQTYNEITQAYEKMKDIDSKGAFASDDEVGQIFTGIKDTIGELENEIIGDK